MKHLLLLAVFIPFAAWAQYAGPAVEACRSHTDAQQKRSGHKPAAECARHGNADARKACIVDLTRRRLLDVR